LSKEVGGAGIEPEACGEIEAGADERGGGSEKIGGDRGEFGRVGGRAAATGVSQVGIDAETAGGAVERFLSGGAKGGEVKAPAPVVVALEKGAGRCGRGRDERAVVTGDKEIVAQVDAGDAVVFVDGNDGRAQVVGRDVEKDGIVIELGVGDSVRAGECADVDGALVGFAAVVFRDVETDDVVTMGRSAVELDKADRGAFVLVGVVILDDAIAAAAVEIVGATVDGRGAALVMDEIVLESDGAALPGPDAERTAAGGRAGSAVVVGGAIFDDTAVDAAEDDAIARVLGVGGIAEVVPGG